MAPPKQESYIAQVQWDELMAKFAAVDAKLAAIYAELLALKNEGKCEGVFDVWHAQYTSVGAPFNVDLSVAGTVEIDQIIGSEFFSGVGLSVIEDVVGIPKTDLRFVSPRRANNTFLYDNRNTFHEDVLALPHGGDGSKKGDWLYFPVGFKFTSGLQIEVETTDVAVSGKLLVVTYGGFAP